MTATAPSSSSHAIPSALWALGYTAVLFSLDEGYNDLRWMVSVGNWLMFGVYALPLFAGLYALFPRLQSLPGLWRRAILPLVSCSLLFWSMAAAMIWLGSA